MDETDHALFPCFSAELVPTALKDTPVVMVTGPRQCGKTTLVRDLVGGKREFITMDDDTVLAAARSDPTGLVRALDRTTIDEVFLRLSLRLQTGNQKNKRRREPR